MKGKSEESNNAPKRWLWQNQKLPLYYENKKNKRFHRQAEEKVLVDGESKTLVIKKKEEKWDIYSAGTLLGHSVGDNIVNCSKIVRAHMRLSICLNACGA